jgi:NDP-sugar pyrophosphorylase family protein
MRAVILAGGQGTRLAPYTLTFPKPMMPVGDYPILEIVVRQLAAYGFLRITLAVGHLAELLEAYFGDGRRWGVEIDYSYETHPLGTVGPLALIEDLKDDFLVMNGDVLTTLDYGELFRYHQQGEAELTIASYRANTKVDFGVLEYDGQHRVVGYREKPVIPYDVSMGVYVFRKTIFDMFEAGESIDLPTLVHLMLGDKRKVKVRPSECRWLDIGRPDDYVVATQDFAKFRHEFFPFEELPETGERKFKSAR